MFNTAQEFNYLKNLYKMDPVGLGISYGIKKFGKPLIDRLKSLRSEAEIEEEEDGIMQMAELNDMQKKMLSGPQKQLKDIMGISNEEILKILYELCPHLCRLHNLFLVLRCHRLLRKIYLHHQ